jgi:hypothetical protein
MENASSYELDSAKLTDALAIVNHELDVLKSLLRTREHSEPRIRISIYLLFVAFLSISILGTHRWLSTRTFLLAFATFFVAYGLVSFFGGWKALREQRRLRQTQRALGLRPDSWVGFVGWKEAGLRYARGAPMILLYLGGSAIAIVGWWRKNLWMTDAGAALVALGSAMFSVFIFGRDLQLFRKRVEDTEQLLDSLLSQQVSLDKGPAISIPEAQYKEIARIERALVNLDRQKAISQRAKSLSPLARAVQQSTTVIAKKATMEPFVRARVQTKIDELSTNPRPAGSRQEPDGHIRLPVAGTLWEISYLLVENQQRTLIQDLLPVTSATATEGK